MAKFSRCENGQEYGQSFAAKNSGDAAREKDLAREKDFGFFLAQTMEVREAGLLPCADYGGERGGASSLRRLRR